MKKCIIIALLVMLGFANVIAQEGGIFFVNYEPDPSLCSETDPQGFMVFDVDGNGSDDLIVDFYIYMIGEVPEFSVNEGWEICRVPDADVDSISLNSSSLSWSKAQDWPGYHEQYGLRKETENGYCYGWFRVYDSHVLKQNKINRGTVYLDCHAFCTIPNYPLRWGQTSLSQGLEENGSVASAMVYPNPANATITVIGESLRRIEITNMLGQRVATHQAEGSQATIDISTLPTGIYFVGITDENGKRCVKKVVKE